MKGTISNKHNILIEYHCGLLTGLLLPELAQPLAGWNFKKSLFSMIKRPYVLFKRGALAPR